MRLLIEIELIMLPDSEDFEFYYFAMDKKGSNNMEDKTWSGQTLPLDLIEWLKKVPDVARENKKYKLIHDII